MESDRPIKVYLAAPVVGVSDDVIIELEKIKHVLRTLDKRGKIELYDPKKHGVPNAWGMSMSEWARCIFTLDVVAIDNADWIVVCDYGRKGTAGTAWEAGYAFGKGKKVLIIEMAKTDTDYSVMMRGCSSNYITKERFISVTIDKAMEFFVERGRQLQKEILN